MSPLVSVYITTHNRSERLIRAVQSVLNQTYKNIEIIVSDDGSKDNTPEIVALLMSKNDNIRYIRSDIVKGANHARNRALEVAKGEFITGLDDDDEFTPERVSFFISKWDDQFSFICDNFVEKTNVIQKPHYKQKERYVFDYKEMLFINSASNQIFTKTSRLNEIGGFNESLKRLQDWDCWLRLAYSFGLAVRYNKKSYIMHQHESGNRVSKNIDYDEAYRILALENIELFSVIKNDFASKYILKTKKRKWYDVFACSSVRECKVVLKSFFYGHS
ncbi:glycosyltransferase family 2 protein [Pseudoalteromonas prydzensis]|uniref:glycosyltransferase family 2 protein n=1 Tax=Pseudoalteromonas prydzensis TaxID=182141 RepID=UPI0024BCEC30|nr:glycosyltransferase [Pseudoalteromonas prydzensis]